MLLPKVTCLPSFDASLVCHLVSTASHRRLGGRPGGLLYVEQPNAAGTREAALQGWTKWLVHADDADKTSVSSFAKPYLKLGFLFGEPEFGISPEVALPMVLQDVPGTEAAMVNIQSSEIGKALACTAAGSLYTTDIAGDTVDDATWRCD